MPAPLLDTHAWLWWMRRDDRLAASLDYLDGLPLDEWLETASHPRTVRVLPISAAIAADTATLPRALRDPTLWSGP